MEGKRFSSGKGLIKILGLMLFPKLKYPDETKIC
jgi:hypothetical protein